MNCSARTENIHVRLSQIGVLRWTKKTNKNTFHFKTGWNLKKRYKNKNRASANLHILHHRSTKHDVNKKYSFRAWIENAKANDFSNRVLRRNKKHKYTYTYNIYILKFPEKWRIHKTLAFSNHHELHEKTCKTTTSRSIEQPRQDQIHNITIGLLSQTKNATNNSICSIHDEIPFAPRFPQWIGGAVGPWPLRTTKRTNPDATLTHK